MRGDQIAHDIANASAANAMTGIRLTMFLIVVLALAYFFAFGIRAITRAGPPDPPSIFIGSAMTDAPVGGS